MPGKQLSLLIVGCIFWNLFLEANCWWPSCLPDRPTVHRGRASSLLSLHSYLINLICAAVMSFLLSLLALQQSSLDRGHVPLPHNEITTLTWSITWSSSLQHVNAGLVDGWLISSTGCFRFLVFFPWTGFFLGISGASPSCLALNEPRDMAQDTDGASMLETSSLLQHTCYLR